MTRVIIEKASYDYKTLRPLIFEIMDRLGGNLIGNHSQVVIKPNCLVPAKPEQAVLTHPLVVRAVVEYVLERGAHPQVLDSPAMGSFERLLKESGLREALRGLDATCRPFRNSVHVDIGEPFGLIEMAEEAVNADFLINLPKLKTHSQMLLTLGVKNLFGCVVGFRKAEWHLRAGINRDLFARLLVQIHEALKPYMTIMDGILALEGDGPGKGGTPRELGLLLASNNALALDATVCRMLSLSPDQLPTCAEAQTMGILDPRFKIEGPFTTIGDFRLPEAASLVYGPEFLHSFVRKQLLQRPVPDNDLCTFCGDCLKYCPAHAIREEDKKLRFDYDRCIRCYCCIEVCPHGALRARDTAAGRLIRKFVGSKTAP
jgi:uncharacterized protein (DUF362 family)/Pyruvate/2-oxoacid:ferredoxin oxidoreductase delta subunit